MRSRCGDVDAGRAGLRLGGGGSEDGAEHGDDEGGDGERQDGAGGDAQGAAGEGGHGSSLRIVPHTPSRTSPRRGREAREWQAPISVANMPPPQPSLRGGGCRSVFAAISMPYWIAFSISSIQALELAVMSSSLSVRVFSGWGRVPKAGSRSAPRSVTGNIQLVVGMIFWAGGGGEIGKELLGQILMVRGFEHAGHFDLGEMAFVEQGGMDGLVAFGDDVVGGRGGVGQRHVGFAIEEQRIAFATIRG